MDTPFSLDKRSVFRLRWSDVEHPNPSLAELGQGVEVLMKWPLVSDFDIKTIRISELPGHQSSIR